VHHGAFAGNVSKSGWPLDHAPGRLAALPLALGEDMPGV
jgi:hypothetical protein